ncbi:DNA polymerase III subunit chi [Methylococcus sp. EFPC2]|uniref:DNA polymerase III subunit chi n=1 Tax=Methylococcus sp. EFPC2 TaxID=2812648 RepID=UPI001967C75F|nr:DNA polymerase III subunit chi [Methylococcus sp. EFPC2]QSA97994.1 DNA polymerase III subunit chi [Methylococcus sp. EFPC2]
MTKVDFYVQTGQDAKQRWTLACKLAEKAYRLGLKVHIRTLSGEQQTMDDLLWTFRQGSFIPHTRTDAPADERAEVPILIGQEFGEGADLLLNLAPDLPPDMSPYPRLAELVNDDPSTLMAGREKFRHYKGLGLEIETHKLGE